MFELIRNHKRWMLFLVLILILPSFVFFGIEGYSRFMAGDQAMAKVGSSTITRAEYDMARRQQLDQGRQMLGAAFDPAIFDTPEARRQTLEQLIDARVLSQAVSDDMLTVSDNVVRRTIAQIPSVQNNGRFDPEIYARLLAAQGMTPASFEAGLRWELAQALVLEPVANSAMVPDSLVADLLAALQRERTVRVAEYLAADYLADVQVSEADVEAYYQAHTDRFEVPEAVDVEYVVLDSQAALAGVDVSDQDIAQYYEQNKNRFKSQAQRAVSHILIEAGNDVEAARARIEEIAARLKEKPESFAEVARAESQDPGSASEGGSLGWISPGMLVPEFETVAFELPAGAISEPVRTDFGWHLIRVDEVREAAVRALDEVRDQLAEEIRLQKGGARFGEMASQLTNLVYDQAESLAAASDGLGLEIRRLEGVQRNAVPDGAPGWFNDGRVMQTLFSSEVLRSGRNSGVIELAPDQLVVVRAAQVHPAHLAPLAEVADSIREQLQRERALERARSEGEAALKQLQAGDTAGVKFGAAMQVSRAAPAALGKDVIEAILEVPESATLPVYVGAPSGSAYVVAEVSEIAPAPQPEPSQVASEQRALENALGQAEARAVLQQLRRHYKVEVDPYAEQVINEGDEAPL